MSEKHSQLTLFATHITMIVSFITIKKIIFPQYINAKLTALNTFVISYLLCGLTALTCSYVTINVTVNQTQVKLNKLTLLFMEHMLDVTRLSLTDVYNSTSTLYNDLDL